jgi:DNA-binding transcriptional LysR family regulator
MKHLDTLKLFNKVAETGSFSEAGRQSGLNASSVSRQINGLEQELGSRLFNRSTRHVALTEAGELYFDYTGRILSELEEAERAVGAMQEEPMGTLRLNISVLFGRRYIAPTLPGFLRRYPDVDVELQVTDRYVDLIEDGVDLAIRVGESTGASLITRKLVSVRRLIVASADYVDRHGEPKTPDELADHDCIRFGSTSAAAKWDLEKNGRVKEVRISGRLFTNNVDMTHTAMLNGGGIAILPTWITGEDIRNGDARIILPAYQPSRSGFSNDIYAVYPHRRHLSAKVRAYIDFFVEAIKGLPEFEGGV